MIIYNHPCLNYVITSNLRARNNRRPNTKKITIANHNIARQTGCRKKIIASDPTIMTNETK